MTKDYKQIKKEIEKFVNEHKKVLEEAIADSFILECKKINELEKECDELKQANENIINEYNKLQAEIIGDIEFKELILTGITPLKVLQNLKQRNRELQAFYDVHESFKTDFDTNRKLLDNYRSALEEIRDTLNKIFNVCDDDCGNASEITKVVDRINEVLNEN